MVLADDTLAALRNTRCFPAVSLPSFELSPRAALKLLKAAGFCTRNGAPKIFTLSLPVRQGNRVRRSAAAECGDLGRVAADLREQLRGVLA